MGKNKERSFTNKKGEKVIVSEEHLNTAVTLKVELQKASPSRKCSWSQLVGLMRKEGFDDAENSEAYRCLVKAYQKSIGELPTVKQYADMVATSKLESIKELVGEISYEKRENQLVLKELNKVKRDITDDALIAEQIGSAFNDLDFSNIKMQYKEVKESEKKMIVALSDLHIGAIVELDINTYNYDIAVKRLNEYANSIITKCKSEKITSVHVMNLGDVIEHSNMRYDQGFSAEFTYSEQITKATDLIIKFLLLLQENGLKITYAGIAGNHDRRDEDKNKNLSGDHAVKHINSSIKMFIELSKIKNVEYVQAKDYKHSFVINGKNFIAVHGDLDNKNDANVLSKRSQMDEVIYDYMLMGHFHSREIKELGNDKLLLVSGSLKGADDYSVDKIKKLSAPSQSYYIIDEDGNLDVNFVVLK